MRSQLLFETLKGGCCLVCTYSQYPSFLHQSLGVTMLHYKGVSKNRGMFPPKSSHFNRGFHYFHHPFWGTNIFGLTPINTNHPDTHVPNMQLNLRDLHLKVHPCSCYIKNHYHYFHLSVLMKIQGGPLPLITYKWGEKAPISRVITPVTYL